MPFHKPESAGGSSEHVRRTGASKDSLASDSPSSTIWVGNLAPGTTDPDIMSVFSKHGALDCTTMQQGSRIYTFMYFRSADEAKAAKAAFQGVKINGSEIKIEFARPAKASKHIWVGGFSSSTSKEQLNDEFLKFGKIEQFKFSRDRNSVIIEYSKMEDAITAHKSMNGKHLAGEQIRIDFLRSQPPRRGWPDHCDSRMSFGSRNSGSLQHSVPQDDTIGFSDSFHLGSKRPMPHGARPDSYPSNILWIGYPPPVQIDEHMLHNAMILFGEIEGIKCFPSRHYALVEFRSVDEARRAKEGLEGRLFNDPRIQILFSNTEPPLEFFNPSHPMLPNAYRGPPQHNGLPRSNIPLPAHMGFDPGYPGTDFIEFGGIPQNFADFDANRTIPPNWRNHSPSAPGVLSPQGLQRLHRSTPDRWEKFDLRESKRSRTDVASIDDGNFPSQNFNGVALEDRSFGFSYHGSGSSSHGRLSPGIGRHIVSRNSPGIDYIWRGVIAKGGNHVCHARCIPIGKGIDSPLPEVVNCYARTGLDMLAKHYAEAISFDIVFFLPDSEEDFSSYTEFLRYLGSKSRAGVAKFDDGTTLFLVPPSEFLTEVLNVRGPERLYGVVLNMPSKSADAAQRQPQETNLPSHYTDILDPHASGNYNLYKNDDQSMKLNYNQSLHENAAHQAIVGHVDSVSVQSVSLDCGNNSGTVSKMEISLTPELIATLASLVPSNTTAGQMPSVSTALPITSGTVAGDGSTSYQGLRHEHPMMPVGSFEQPGNLPALFGQQDVNQTPPISQFLPYGTLSTVAEQTINPVVGSLQVNNPPVPPPGISRPLNSYMNIRDGHISASQRNQTYGIDSSSSSLNNYGMLPGASVTVDTFSSMTQTQQVASSSSHDMSQVTMSFPLSGGAGNVSSISQGQHMQSGFPATGAGTSQDDADKNQRYQSTLQFAANLLRQIKQQQSGNQAIQGGAGNQQ